MGYSCGQATGWTTSYVTISLTVDFVGSANVGQWLAIESDVIKTGSTICFAQSLIKADGVTFHAADGQGLPTIYVDGPKLEGAQSPEVLKQTLDSAIRAL